MSTDTGNEWLDSLKPGDKAAVECTYYGSTVYGRVEVDRVLKYHIVATNGDRFHRGCGIQKSDRSRRLVRLTIEVQIAIETSAFLTGAQDLVRVLDMPGSGVRLTLPLIKKLRGDLWDLTKAVREHSGPK